MVKFLFLVFLCILSFRQVLGTVEYIVYPTDVKDVEACKKTTEFLNELLFSGNVNPCVINSLKMTRLWLVYAEKDDFEQIMKDDGASQKRFVECATARLIIGTG